MADTDHVTFFSVEQTVSDSTQNNSCQLQQMQGF